MTYCGSPHPQDKQRSCVVIDPGRFGPHVVHRDMWGQTWSAVDGPRDRDEELRELLSYLQSEASTSVHDAEAAAYDDAAGKLQKLLDGE
jgi:hypothetical protein